jgi:glycosyltransferase involved in cell wall biosynthesis
MIEKEKNKKVLMITYVFPPIAYVGTFRSLRFCQYLPENGWEPIVLTIKETKDLQNDFNLIKRLPPDIKIYRTHTIDFQRIYQNFLAHRKNSGNPGCTKPVQAPNVKIKVKRKSFFKKIYETIWAIITYPDHMVFWIPFAVLKGIYILLKEKCDVIYTSSPPHSEQITGLLLSRLFNKPWIADFRDPMLDASGYVPDKIRLKLDSIIEREVVRQASKVLVISKRYKDIIEKRYPEAVGKFEVMLNGFDPKLYENVVPTQMDKFTITYAGGFYFNRQPFFFFRGLKKWIDKYQIKKDSFQCLFFGSFPKTLDEFIATENIADYIKLSGFVPQDQLLKTQTGAHAQLLILGFDKESAGTIPSKIFEYMACRRPILAIIPDGDTADILKTYPLFYWVEHEDEDVLVERIEEIHTEYKRHQFLSNKLKIPEMENAVNAFNGRSQTTCLAGYLEHVMLRK